VIDGAGVKEGEHFFWTVDESTKLNMRVLFCTNNVGNIFDQPDERLEWWLNTLEDDVTGTSADFVAIHLQELAGNPHADLDAASMAPIIERLSTLVRARFPDYWSSGIMCPSVFTPDFTGLGCLVLVRRSVSRDVALYAFGERDSMSGWKPVSTLHDPLVPKPSLPSSACRHGSFPRRFFDVLDRNWTRKGWLHTRWRLDGKKRPVWVVS
jgi:hypothetical protein